MSTFSSPNVMDGNLLLKERTHRIKVTYSRNFYALLRQLANSTCGAMKSQKTDRQFEVHGESISIIGGL